MIKEIKDSKNDLPPKKSFMKQSRVLIPKPISIIVEESRSQQSEKSNNGSAEQSDNQRLKMINHDNQDDGEDMHMMVFSDSLDQIGLGNQRHNHKNFRTNSSEVQNIDNAKLNSMQTSSRNIPKLHSDQ